MSGDRQGRTVHHPLPTLSIGAIRVAPELFGSHHEVAEAATDAKKMAKEIARQQPVRRTAPHLPARAAEEPCAAESYAGAEAHYG